MGIDNAIFQDLESFRKREVFRNGYGKVLDVCLEQSLPKFTISTAVGIVDVHNIYFTNYYTLYFS